MTEPCEILSCAVRPAFPLLLRRGDVHDIRLEHERSREAQLKQNDRGGAVPKAIKSDVPGASVRMGRNRSEPGAATARSKAASTTQAGHQKPQQLDVSKDDPVAPSAGTQWWMDRSKTLERKITELEVALSHAETKVAQLSAEYANAQGNLAARAEAEGIAAHRMAELATKLADAETEVARLSTNNAATESKLLARAESDRIKARTSESRAQAEIVKMMTRMQHANQGAKRYAHEAEWLRAVYALMFDRPRWWFLMSDAWRSIKIRRRLRRRGLFDADAYLALYPDVANAGIDPLSHYISHGLAEGRSNGID